MRVAPGYPVRGRGVRRLGSLARKSPKHLPETTPQITGTVSIHRTQSPKLPLAICWSNDKKQIIHLLKKTQPHSALISVLAPILVKG
jgi:hypothetical protein